MSTKKTEIVNITRIEKYMGKTYNTLMKWRRNLNFPMFKKGGQWVLFKEDVADWEACQKAGKKYEFKEPKTRKRSTKSE